MPVYRGPGGAGDATNDATVTAVQAAATSAATSATNAANSATAAATSASGASTSATNAATSATSSAGSATSSANSATTSSNFATNSSLSADDSAASAVEAAGYASDAFDYSVAASVSSGTASDYADSAIAASASAYAHELAAEAVLTDPDFVAVLAIAADIDALSPITADITTVAGIAADVTTVATDSADIVAVSANLDNIGIVAEKEDDINAVVAIASDITAVAAIDTDVTTVAGIAANVTTVATNNANVTTVATNIANVNNVGNNIANVNQVAADTVVINSASANATAAAASALSASGSATSASASAAAASAVALGNEPVRHSVRPSLLLDFANTKTLDPRITFTRASTATYYDGKTVAKAEENLLTYSEQFDNGVWIKQALTVTANSIAAPDGTTTADSFVASNAVNGASGVYRVTPTATTQSISCFVKAGNKTQVVLATAGGTNNAWFNLSTGAVGSKHANITSTSISDAGNGWYRISLVRPWVTGIIGVYFSDADNSLVCTGDGATVSGYVWGIQFEDRTSLTAYTATTTAPITNYIPALQTAAAGVARFEHNPVTGESLGLEIEEQRTNLLTYSSDFSNSVWAINSTATRTAATTISPDGTLTANTLSNVSGTQFGVIYTGTTATTYTYSIWLKRKTGSGTIQILDVNGNTTNITVTNDWKRFTITSTSSSTTIRAYLRILTTGDELFAWGAQLEAGSFATSYIPTVASQVTRSADSASMTGTNFSSWYRADEGTLYVEAAANTASSVASAAFVLNNGSLSNSIWCWQNIQGSSFRSNYVQNAGSGVVLISHSAVTLNSFNKAVATYKSASYAGVLNGGTVGTSTYSQVISGINQASIGMAFNQQQLNGTIKKIAYYPKQLASAEIQGVATV